MTIEDFNEQSGISSCFLVTTQLGSLSTTCGASHTVVGWQFDAPPPTISAIANGGSASCSAPSRAVRVTGTGLSMASAVYFGLVSGSDGNQSYLAATFTVKSDTTIDACTPSAGTGSSDVVVGTSSDTKFGPAFTL